VFEGLLVSKSAADAVKVMPLPVSADGVIVVVVTLSGISAGRFVPVENLSVLKSKRYVLSGRVSGGVFGMKRYITSADWAY